MNMDEERGKLLGPFHPALSEVTDLSNLYRPTSSDLPLYDVGSSMPSSPCPSDSSSRRDSTESESAAKRRKRRVKPPEAHLRDLLCGVCGDKAHGYNFNAVTCESCKAFFRRNALRAEVQNIKCNFEGNCVIDAHTRRFCTECRLRKCFIIGMKKDWILSDDQLTKRRERSRVKKELAKMSLAHCGTPQKANNTPPSTMSFSLSPCDDSGGETYIEVSPSISGCDSRYNNPPSPKDCAIKDECHSPVSSVQSPSSTDHNKFTEIEEEQICARLQAIEQTLMDTVDTPYSEAQVSKFTPSSPPGMFNMADTFIRRFIKFCKCLPEFAELTQQDQIALLKGGIMELMLLRGALKFDPHSLAFHFKLRASTAMAYDGANNKMTVDGAIPTDIISRLSNPDPTASSTSSAHESPSNQHAAVQFFIGLNSLVKSQKTPILVLMLIELFSPDRPDLVEKEKVAKIQEYYSHVLYIFLRRCMPDELDNGIFPKLLMKLVDVRELGEASSSAASKMEVSAFEPLLVEVFSLR